jgi:hypothetical protein
MIKPLCYTRPGHAYGDIGTKDPAACNDFLARFSCRAGADAVLLVLTIAILDVLTQNAVVATAHHNQ